MMRRFVYLLIFALAGLSTACSSMRAETTNAVPNFQQVYDLLRANLAGVSEAELNAAAVDGLLKQLHDRAAIVGGSQPSNAAPGGTNLLKSAALENNVAYFRVMEVGNGLAKQMDAAYRTLAATNQLAGVALDLRFAGGSDYAAAIAAANLFVTKKMPLLEWDNKIETSHPAKETISGPLLVLVNGETSGAAEALAAALREAGAGLIIGNATAGLALTMQDFQLKNGEQLRIAIHPVKLGNGAILSSVSPDIKVPVSQKDEREYLKNPYARLGEGKTASTTSTNDFLAFVDHTSEADLVRQKLKAGDNAGILAPVPAPRKSPPQSLQVIQDPVLARALDLIKGLAIVHEDRL